MAKKKKGPTRNMLKDKQETGKKASARVINEN